MPAAFAQGTYDHTVPQPPWKQLMKPPTVVPYSRGETASLARDRKRTVQRLPAKQQSWREYQPRQALARDGFSVDPGPSNGRPCPAPSGLRGRLCSSS